MREEAVCRMYEAGFSADFVENGPMDLFWRERGVFGERRDLRAVVLGEVLLEIMFLNVRWFFWNDWRVVKGRWEKENPFWCRLKDWHSSEDDGELGEKMGTTFGTERTSFFLVWPMGALTALTYFL